MQANTYSQKTKISIAKENITVREVLDEIESLSEFKFLFKTNTVDLNRKVTVKFKHVPIDDILKSLFNDQNVTYEIKDRKIFLKKDSKLNRARDKTKKSKPIKER